MKHGFRIFYMHYINYSSPEHDSGEGWFYEFDRMAFPRGGPFVTAQEASLAASTKTEGRSAAGSFNVACIADVVRAVAAGGSDARKLGDEASCVLVDQQYMLEDRQRFSKDVVHAVKTGTGEAQYSDFCRGFGSSPQYRKYRREVRAAMTPEELALDTAWGAMRFPRSSGQQRKLKPGKIIGGRAGGTRAAEVYSGKGLVVVTLVNDPVRTDLICIPDHDWELDW